MYRSIFCTYRLLFGEIACILWLGKCYFRTLDSQLITSIAADSWFFCRYPNPSAFTYENRLFRPFEYALQPPVWYKEEHIAVSKPELPFGETQLKQYGGPQCFVIPGNHGWF